MFKEKLFTLSPTIYTPTSLLVVIVTIDYPKSFTDTGQFEVAAQTVPDASVDLRQDIIMGTSQIDSVEIQRPCIREGFEERICLEPDDARPIANHRMIAIQERVRVMVLNRPFGVLLAIVGYVCQYDIPVVGGSDGCGGDRNRQFLHRFFAKANPLRGLVFLYTFGDFFSPTQK